MKKTILLLCLFLALIITSKTKANPITPPPVVAELYFDNNNWFIELLVGSFVGINTSDSLVLITSTDTILFRHFTYTPDVPFIITADSLIAPLTINKNGDKVLVSLKNNQSFMDLDFQPMIFGSMVGAQVTAPQPGQSVKRLRCYDPYTPEYSYYVVKDNNPTLGSDPFNAEANSSFSGYVYDSNHNPLPFVYYYGNHSIYCSSCQFTDANGYFHCVDYSYIRTLCFQQQYCTTIDTVFSIEPDSDYIMEFTFDSCYVGISDISQINNSSLQIFPNPGSENFIFQITAHNFKNKNCLIKIYNAVGELVNILPVNSDNYTATVKWDGKGRYNDLPSGIYTCSLASDGNILASQKLIIEK